MGAGVDGAMIRAALGAWLLIADHASIPLDARLPNPNDRLLNAYAAARRYGAPAIVVEHYEGTATTIDATPGACSWAVPSHQARAGERRGACPHVSPGSPTAIGTDTSDAIRGGGRAS